MSKPSKLKVTVRSQIAIPPGVYDATDLVIYRPGAATVVDGNVFTDWSTLMAEVAARRQETNP